MKTAVIFTLFLSLLMLTMVAAPALAAPPTAGTFTLGQVARVVDPGKQWTTDNILHVRDQISTLFFYGAPWGAGTGSATLNLELDTASHTGSGIAHFVATYASGTIEGIVNFRITGGGLYTYEGSTFTAFDAKTVHTGDKFVGLLLTANVVWHGTGGLEGLQIRGTSTGVTVQSGPFAGLAVRSTTGEYWSTA